MTDFRGIVLATRREVPVRELEELFGEPGSAIAALTEDLEGLWDLYRSPDPDRRRIGSIHLLDGAYLQWIGYASRLVIEVSSNEYLREKHQLTQVQMRTLARAGFSPPSAEEPNHFLRVGSRQEIPRTAFAMVAALTAVFGVYAG